APEITKTNQFSAKKLDLAKALVSKLAGPFKPEQYKDEHREERGAPAGAETARPQDDGCESAEDPYRREHKWRRSGRAWRSRRRLGPIRRAKKSASRKSRKAA